MTFHLTFFSLTFFSFHGILILYEQTGRVVTLFYTTFTDVIERRHFTVIFLIFPRSWRDFADFCRYLLAALVISQARAVRIIGRR